MKTLLKTLSTLFYVIPHLMRYPVVKLKNKIPFLFHSSTLPILQSSKKMLCILPSFKPLYLHTSIPLSLKKMLCIFLTACFFATSVCHDVAAAVAMPAMDATQYKQIFTDFILPYSYGKITKSHFAGTDRVIINIQDLHCHPQVQKNISNIIELFDKKYGVTNVYLEGAYGNVSTKWLTENIKNDKKKAEILNKILGTGKLTGAEYYSATSDKTEIIKGLEKKEPYLDNLKRFGDLLEKQDEIQIILKGIEESTAKVKKQYYTRRQYKIEKLSQEYMAGKIKPEKYYRLLSKHTEKLGIDLTKYENTFTYIRLLALQKQLDYKAITSQLQALVMILKEKLPYNAYKMLLDNTKNFEQTDKLYTYIIKISKEFGLDLMVNFKELNKYFTYIELSQKINPLELIKEEERLTREINTRFSDTVAQREVVFLTHFEKYLKDYMSTKITSDDYEYYKENIETYKKLYNKYVDNKVFSLLKPYMDEIDVFYKINTDRNDYFTENIFDGIETGEIENIKEEPKEVNKIIENMGQVKRVDVIVTGGFHSQTVTDILQNEGVSYIVITPNVQGGVKEAEKTYYQIAKEQKEINFQTLATLPISLVYGSKAAIPFKIKLMLDAEVPIEIIEKDTGWNRGKIEEIRDMTPEDFNKIYAQKTPGFNIEETMKMKEKIVKDFKKFESDDEIGIYTELLGVIELIENEKLDYDEKINLILYMLDEGYEENIFKGIVSFLNLNGSRNKNKNLGHALRMILSVGDTSSFAAFNKKAEEEGKPRTNYIVKENGEIEKVANGYKLKDGENYLFVNYANTKNGEDVYDLYYEKEDGTPFYFSDFVKQQERQETKDDLLEQTNDRMSLPYTERYDLEQSLEQIEDVAETQGKSKKDIVKVLITSDEDRKKELEEKLENYKDRDWYEKYNEMDNSALEEELKKLEEKNLNTEEKDFIKNKIEISDINKRISILNEYTKGKITDKDEVFDKKYHESFEAYLMRKDYKIGGYNEFLKDFMEDLDATGEMSKKQHDDTYYSLQKHKIESGTNLEDGMDTRLYNGNYLGEDKFILTENGVVNYNQELVDILLNNAEIRDIFGIETSKLSKLQAALSEVVKKDGTFEEEYFMDEYPEEYKILESLSRARANVLLDVLDETTQNKFKNRSTPDKFKVNLINFKNAYNIELLKKDVLLTCIIQGKNGVEKDDDGKISKESISNIVDRFINESFVEGEKEEEEGKNIDISDYDDEYLNDYFVLKRNEIGLKKKLDSLKEGTSEYERVERNLDKVTKKISTNYNELNKAWENKLQVQMGNFMVAPGEYFIKLAQEFENPDEMLKFFVDMQIDGILSVWIVFSYVDSHRDQFLSENGEIDDIYEILRLVHAAWSITNAWDGNLAHLSFDDLTVDEQKKDGDQLEIMRILYAFETTGNIFTKTLDVLNLSDEQNELREQILKKWDEESVKMQEKIIKGTQTTQEQTEDNILSNQVSEKAQIQDQLREETTEQTPEDSVQEKEQPTSTIEKFKNRIINLFGRSSGDRSSGRKLSLAASGDELIDNYLMPIVEEAAFFSALLWLSMVNPFIAIPVFLLLRLVVFNLLHTDKNMIAEGTVWLNFKSRLFLSKSQENNLKILNDYLDDFTRDSEIINELNKYLDEAKFDTFVTGIKVYSTELNSLQQELLLKKIYKLLSDSSEEKKQEAQEAQEALEKLSSIPYDDDFVKEIVKMLQAFYFLRDEGITTYNMVSYKSKYVKNKKTNEEVIEDEEFIAKFIADAISSSKLNIWQQEQLIRRIYNLPASKQYALWSELNDNNSKYKDQKFLQRIKEMLDADRLEYGQKFAELDKKDRKEDVIVGQSFVRKMFNKSPLGIVSLPYVVPLVYFASGMFNPFWIGLTGLIVILAIILHISNNLDADNKLSLHRFNGKKEIEEEQKQKKINLNDLKNNYIKIEESIYKVDTTPTFTGYNVKFTNIISGNVDNVDYELDVSGAELTITNEEEVILINKEKFDNVLNEINELQITEEAKEHFRKLAKEGKLPSNAISDIKDFIKTAQSSGKSLDENYNLVGYDDIEKTIYYDDIMKGNVYLKWGSDTVTIAGKEISFDTDRGLWFEKIEKKFYSEEDLKEVGISNINMVGMTFGYFCVQYTKEKSEEKSQEIIDLKKYIQANIADLDLEERLMNFLDDNNNNYLLQGNNLKNLKKIMEYIEDEDSMEAIIDLLEKLPMDDRFEVINYLAEHGENLKDIEEFNTFEEFKNFVENQTGKIEKTKKETETEKENKQLQGYDAVLQLALLPVHFYEISKRKQIIAVLIKNEIITEKQAKQIFGDIEIDKSSIDEGIEVIFNKRLNLLINQIGKKDITITNKQIDVIKEISGLGKDLNYEHIKSLDNLLSELGLTEKGVFLRVFSMLKVTANVKELEETYDDLGKEIKKISFGIFSDQEIIDKNAENIFFALTISLEITKKEDLDKFVDNAIKNDNMNRYGYIDKEFLKDFIQKEGEGEKFYISCEDDEQKVYVNYEDDQKLKANLEKEYDNVKIEVKEGKKEGRIGLIEGLPFSFHQKYGFYYIKDNEKIRLLNLDLRDLINQYASKGQKTSQTNPTIDMEQKQLTMTWLGKTLNVFDRIQRILNVDEDTIQRRRNDAINKIENPIMVLSLAFPGIGLWFANRHKTDNEIVYAQMAFVLGTAMPMMPKGNIIKRLFEGLKNLPEAISFYKDNKVELADRHTFVNSLSTATSPDKMATELTDTIADKFIKRMDDNTLVYVVKTKEQADAAKIDIESNGIENAMILYIENDIKENGNLGIESGKNFRGTRRIGKFSRLKEERTDNLTMHATVFSKNRTSKEETISLKDVSIAITENVKGPNIVNMVDMEEKEITQADVKNRRRVSTIYSTNTNEGVEYAPEEELDKLTDVQIMNNLKEADTLRIKSLDEIKELNKRGLLIRIKNQGVSIKLSINSKQLETEESKIIDEFKAGNINGLNVVYKTAKEAKAGIKTLNNIAKQSGFANTTFSVEIEEDVNNENVENFKELIENISENNIGLVLNKQQLQKEAVQNSLDENNIKVSLNMNKEFNEEDSDMLRFVANYVTSDTSELTEVLTTVMGIPFATLKGAIRTIANTIGIAKTPTQKFEKGKNDVLKRINISEFNGITGDKFFTEDSKFNKALSELLVKDVENVTKDDIQNIINSGIFSDDVKADLQSLLKENKVYEVYGAIRGFTQLAMQEIAIEKYLAKDDAETADKIRKQLSGEYSDLRDYLTIEMIKLVAQGEKLDKLFDEMEGNFEMTVEKLEVLVKKNMDEILKQNRYKIDFSTPATLENTRNILYALDSQLPKASIGSKSVEVMAISATRSMLAAA